MEKSLKERILTLWEKHSIEIFIVISYIFLVLKNCEELFTNYITDHNPDWINQVFKVYESSQLLNWTTFILSIIGILLIIYRLIKKRECVSPFLFCFLTFMLFSYRDREVWDYLNLPFSDNFDYRHLLDMFLSLFLIIEIIIFFTPSIFHHIGMLICSCYKSKKQNDREKYIDDTINYNANEHILSVIRDYLKTKETEYALMINGAWGKGKTYFIKTTLKEEIRRIILPNKNCNIRKKKYKQIYISLYGISSIDEIKEHIFYEINPKYKWMGSVSNRIVSLTENIPSYGNIIRNIAKLNNKEKESIINKLNNYEDKVIIFDDLERIDLKKLDIQSALGFINFLVEHNHCKIIVVANDEKLKNEYKRFKEKSIRFSYKYSPDMPKIFDSVCARYDNRYKTFLNKQKQFILDILVAGKCENIRTLIFITDVFQKIFEKIEGDFSDEINKDLLLPFTIISIEAKNGKTKEKLKYSIQQINSLSLSNLLTNESANEEKNDSKEKYEKLLNNKYGRFRNEGILFNDIFFDLVYEGYFSKEVLENIIKTRRKEYQIKEGLEESNLVSKINNWTVIPDEEFFGVINKIIKTIPCEKFNVAELLKIYAAFIQIDAMKINKFTLSDEDTNSFKHAIDIAMKDKPYDYYLEIKLPAWYNPLYENEDEETIADAEAREKYNLMLKYALSINLEHKKGEDSRKAERVLEFIKGNKTEKFLEFISDINNRITFVQIPYKNLVASVISADAKTKQIFLWGLQSFFPENLVNPELEHINYLNDIKTELDNYLNKQSERKNKLSNLYYAQSYITRILKKYQSIVTINTKGQQYKNQ